jgi:predicted transcriptional regulator
MPVVELPVSDKQIATEALAHMPEIVSLREISEELAILAAIREAQADVSAGRVVTHEEVKRRSALWITK